ncbi:MAG: four-carbon acid sugar kinase family protein [Erysipelotrichaceae bacterium]
MVQYLQSNYPEILDKLYKESVFNIKWVMLDDDPTGVQTLHDVSVYTQINEESVRSGFEEENNIFVLLTNSRALQKEETIIMHREIASLCDKISKDLNINYLFLSRSDSTLRGHYPLETDILNETVKADATILCPFFLEGNRFTIHNEHYILMNNELVKAQDSEFAKDNTFGYRSSNLHDYVIEKHGGNYPENKIKHIDIDDLREMNFDKIESVLMKVTNNDVITVDACSYDDLKVFALCIYNAIKNGKRFVFRCAASLVKVIARISDKPLLKKEELIDKDSSGGLVICGSHTAKTNSQIESLRQRNDVISVEFDVNRIKENESQRVRQEAEKYILDNKVVLIYTSRLVIKSEDKAESLKISTDISDALTDIVKKMNVKPGFIIAKGGITSSDIGVKGLGVTKAKVMGQIKPGIPVWKCDENSKFKDLPYIIFPGNVGYENTLKEIVDELR